MASSTTPAHLAIDVGGTFLKSAVLTPAGDILPDTAYAAPSHSDGSQEEILGAFRSAIVHARTAATRAGRHLEGIGLAIPGPFDCARATSLMEHKFQAIRGLDLRVQFRRMGVPMEVPIRFIHDANAMLEGELWKGNGQGRANVAVVTLGTGLGFAVSQGGQVLRNELGGPAVSIFRTPYRGRILEDYASKRGILRIYGEQSGGSVRPAITVADIGRWADEGDALSQATFATVGAILGEALCDVLRGHEIECLLFAGQISRSFQHLERPLRAGLARVTCLRHISAARSIDHAALWGALRAVLAP